MSLTRKDFERAAAILRDIREESCNHCAKPDWDDATDLMEAHLITWFQSENPRFDAERFRKAAQP